MANKVTWNVKDQVVQVLYMDSACDYNACEHLAEKILHALAIPPMVRDSEYDSYLKTKKRLTELMEGGL